MKEKKPMLVWAKVHAIGQRIGRTKFSKLADARAYAASKGRGIRLRFV